MTTKHSRPAEQRLGSGSVCRLERCGTVTYSHRRSLLFYVQRKPKTPLCHQPTAYQRPHTSLHRIYCSFNHIFSLYIYSFIHNLNIHKFHTLSTKISRQWKSKAAPHIYITYRSIFFNFCFVFFYLFEVLRCTRAHGKEGFFKTKMTTEVQEVFFCLMALIGGVKRAHHADSRILWHKKCRWGGVGGWGGCNYRLGETGGKQERLIVLCIDWHVFVFSLTPVTAER